MTKIVLDGDNKIMSVDETAVKFNLLQDLVTPLTASLGMLPAVTRWISPEFRSPGLAGNPNSPKISYAIVEALPNYRTILFQDQPIRIPVPWQQYLYQFTPGEVGALTCRLVGFFYSLTEMKNEDHFFYRPSLPNCFSAQFPDASFHIPYNTALTAELSTYLGYPHVPFGYLYTVCFNSFANEYIINATKWRTSGQLASFNEAHHKIAQNFWSTQFNTDYAEEFLNDAGVSHPDECDYVYHDDDTQEYEEEDFDVSTLQDFYEKMTIEDMTAKLASDVPIFSVKAFIDLCESLSHHFSLSELFTAAEIEAEKVREEMLRLKASAKSRFKTKPSYGGGSFTTGNSGATGGGGYTLSTSVSDWLLAANPTNPTEQPAIVEEPGVSDVYADITSASIWNQPTNSAWHVTNDDFFTFDPYGVVANPNDAQAVELEEDNSDDEDEVPDASPYDEGL